MGSANWSKVQEHLRGRYRLQTDEAQSFLLGFAVEPPGPEAPSPGGEALVQGVHGQHLLVDGRELLLLRAEVCSDRALDPLAALLHSAKLVLGALVLTGNHYVLRYSLPLSSLALPDLDYALAYLAREAALTRARIAQHNASPEVRSRVPHWTE
jgi:hypothetical protein